MLLQGLQVPNPSLTSAQPLLPAQLLARAHTPPRLDHDDNEPLPLPLARSKTAASIDGGK